MYVHSSFMHCQVQETACVELSFEGNRSFVNFDQVAILLIAFADVSAIGCWVSVGNKIEQAVAILKEAYTGVFKSTAFRETQRELGEVFFESILNVKQNLLFRLISEPA